MRKPKLGQNFLVDETAQRAIADALGVPPSAPVIEIGPGHGAITSILAPRCKQLIAIELDDALVRELEFRYRGKPQVRVVHADVLRVDFGELLSGTSGAEAVGADVVGNLPYYITSDILLHLFAAARKGLLRRAVLMMQREVAERLGARPRVRDYGLLSVTAQMHGHVETLFTLPPSAFSPPPDVYSTVLRMEFAPRFEELGVDFEGLNRFLKQSFAQKRKTLSNNLRHAGFTPEQLRGAWPGGVGEQARAEAMSVEELAAVYRGLRDEGSIGETT
jgi:16S rRNA (adenine1518-N6/adenine1519-N6)-dimethyltransferase